MTLSMRGFLVAALATSALLVAPAAAFALPAPTLFLTTGGSGSPSKTASPSNLWRVDPANGATISVGNTGYAIGALAQDPTTGILYAASNNKSPITANTLLRLDPATGAATVVGPVGEQKIADMSFDSSGRLFGWSEENDELVSINTATGAATAVAPNEISTYGSGSAFDKNDTYWLLGEGEGEVGVNTEGSFYTVDTSTGLPTLHGQLSPIDLNESAISAAAYDCARTTLYATVNNYGEPPANLVTVDTNTGALTNKGLVPTGADGLEWYCPLAFEFTGAGSTVAAGAKKTFSVPVVRGPRIKGGATVAFATVNGSAHAGTDFVKAAGTLTFANNGTEGTVPLTVTPDPKAGKNRKFTLQLSSPSAGGNVGAPFTVTVKAGKPKPAQVKGPKSTSAERVTFKLRSTQLPAHFRCKLDKGKFKGCGKNSKKGKKFKTAKLAPGTHKLVVQVVNGAGLKSKPVKKTFVVLP
jgi:hypothetical protein